MKNDTVFALSTPVGGAIAIIRITGEQAKLALNRVFVSASKKEPEHRLMTYGNVIDPLTKEVIDSAMACYFKAPNTYTGEDMAELYIHGGRVTVQRTLLLLSAFLRPAEGGEFTRRAFMNGKMDLSQAEAVMDVISAVTEKSAKFAQEQLSGSVGSGIKAAEDKLINILSGVEAALDYPDELEEDTLPFVEEKVSPIIAELNSLIRGGNAARIYREGALAVIVGAPNAGKSSLFNALMGLERAIVTPIAGTTRDTLEETIDLFGAPLRLTDTAGIRRAADEAERMGVDRAKAAYELAQLVLFTIDGTGEITDDIRTLLNETAYKKRIIILTKADKTNFAVKQELIPYDPVCISSRTGEGMDLLKEKMASAILSKEGESALITNARHIRALIEAKEALSTISAFDTGDITAAALRTALYALGQITGREVTEDVIDAIFANFCVGK